MSQMPPGVEHANDVNVKLKDPLSAITERIVETYEECGAIHHLGHCPLPSYREVVDILADLHEVLYPGYGRRQNLQWGMWPTTSAISSRFAQPVDSADRPRLPPRLRGEGPRNLTPRRRKAS